MSEKRNIFYKKNFDNDFEEIYKYIEHDSPQNAKKFASELKKLIMWIIKNPTAGTIETQLYSKNDWYRFKKIMKSWKIIYKVTTKLLVFLGIIHVKKHHDNIKSLRTNNYE